MRNSRDQRGEGGIKAILFVAVLAYVVMCGVKIIPASTDDASMEKKVQEILRFAGTNNIKKVADLQLSIDNAIKSYNIPVEPDKVEVTDEGNQWRVKLSYTRQVKLIFWTWKKDRSINEVGAK